MLKRVGICGGGVVGGGVYEILSSKFGSVCTVTKVAVRSLSKPRDWDSSGTILTESWLEVVEDPNIDVIVEVMGGTTTARECVMKALSLGKPVVTANKALLAEYCDEIGSAAQALGFEAAVCGGIPIIATLQQHLAGDNIRSVSGIMNGTTNFMLSKMEAEGADYDDVLAEAQALGFAEADPTADVEGHDVRAKIALLAKLAFGVTVNVDVVPTAGISKIQSVDFEYAKLLGGTIRLLGTAALDSQDNLSVYVAPHVVPTSHVAGFASATGPTNVVSINSQQLGVLSLSGAGAGRYPTARSIVADVIRVCQNQISAPFPPAGTAKLSWDYKAKFYVRISAKDALGIVKTIGELAEKHKVSINAILQNPITDPNNMAFVVTTDTVEYSAVKAFAGDVGKTDFAIAEPLIINMLD